MKNALVLALMIALCCTGSMAVAQSTQPFPDVPKDHWAYQAVMELKQRGILIGYPKGTLNKQSLPPTIERTMKSPEQTKQQMDFIVLETVLSGLLEGPDFAEAFGKEDILLGIQTPAPPFSEDLSLYTGGESAHSLPAEVRADLWTRNTEMARVIPTVSQFKLAQHRWDKFNPESNHILVRDVRLYLGFIKGSAQFTKDYPKAKGFVIAWLPGYSKDMKTAVVPFILGPNAHGARGTYLLMNRGGKWTIQWRFIRHFL